MKNTKYIIFFPLTLLLLSSTACSKHTPTAAEINESIAQEKALKESQAAEEAKAAEDAKSQEDDKFLTEFGKAEKEEEEAQKAADKAVEEAEKTDAEHYVVEVPLSEVNSIESSKEINADNSSDSLSTTTDLLGDNQTPKFGVVTNQDTNTVTYDITALEDEYYIEELTSDIAYQKYATKEELNSVIDQKYADYPDTVKDKIKSEAGEVFDYWQEKYEEVATQPNPWTEEELAENPERAHYTREEWQAEEDRLKALGLVLGG